jgi:excisionase family DNA binding protein
MKLLIASEVAEIMSVTEARVYELARRKMIPHIRLGRQVRFSEKVLLEWVERGGITEESVGLDVAAGPKHRNQNHGIAA